MSYTISVFLLKAAIKKSPYKSIESLSAALGIHRNTINHYLSGASVFPKSLENIFKVLQINPWDVIQNKKEESKYKVDIIYPIVEKLNAVCPEACYILFGSRARNEEKQFSDFDIGTFVNKELSFDDFYKIKEVADEAAEDLPVEVDLVNLTKADTNFFVSIKKGYKFLGGSPVSMKALEEKIHE